MKPSLSLICSSVIPICRSSAKTPCISGSAKSIVEDFSGGCVGAIIGGGEGCFGTGAGGRDAGIVGVVAFEEPLPRSPLNSERPDFGAETGAGP